MSPLNEIPLGKTYEILMPEIFSRTVDSKVKYNLNTKYEIRCEYFGFDETEHLQISKKVNENYHLFIFYHFALKSTEDKSTIFFTSQAIIKKHPYEIAKFEHTPMGGKLTYQLFHDLCNELNLLLK